MIEVSFIEFEKDSFYDRSIIILYNNTLRQSSDAKLFSSLLFPHS